MPLLKNWGFWALKLSIDLRSLKNLSLFGIHKDIMFSSSWSQLSVKYSLQLEFDSFSLRSLNLTGLKKIVRSIWFINIYRHLTFECLLMHHYLTAPNFFECLLNFCSNILLLSWVVVGDLTLLVVCGTLLYHTK
jgi:hypothetical protein